jgi:uncharacterized protein (DUF1697 family)
MARGVAFLRRAPDATAAKAIDALKTRTDDFHTRGRELYWLSTNRQSASKISNAMFEKILGEPSTMRGISTIRKLAEKLTAD